MLADVTFSDAAIGIITALLVALSGAIAVLFRMVIANYDSQLTYWRSKELNWQEMTERAVSGMENEVNRKRVIAGKQPFPVLAAVLPEHSSPVTQAQKHAADLETMKARLVAAELSLDIELEEKGGDGP